MSAGFPQVLVGPGDDCAAVGLPGAGAGAVGLLTVDHLVEGRHFPCFDGAFEPGTLRAVARKAVARSVSDIGAMGGVPHASLATACLASGFPQEAADALFGAMHEWAAFWGAPLVGGDVATFAPVEDAFPPPPLVLTTTILGIPHAARGPVLRSTARVGDEVYVTGELGGSLESGRHLEFVPRVEEGDWIAGRLAEHAAGSGTEVASCGAMMDLSDGLGRDGTRLARASRVRLTLESDLFPTFRGCGWDKAMSDGEDYELLFTAPASMRWPEACPNGTRITRIGRVTPGDGCVVRTPEGQLTDASGMGWEHR